MEANIFRAADVDAAVHRTKEEVGLITEADFGAGILHRETGEGSDVGHDDTVRARAVGRGGALIGNRQARIGSETGMEPPRGLMMYFRFLATEQKRRVHAPVEGQFTAFGIADNRLGRIPGYRRPQAAEAAARHKGARKTVERLIDVLLRPLKAVVAAAVGIRRVECADARIEVPIGIFLELDPRIRGELRKADADIQN